MRPKDVARLAAGVPAHSRGSPQFATFGHDGLSGPLLAPVAPIHTRTPGRGRFPAVGVPQSQSASVSAPAPDTGEEGQPVFVRRVDSVRSSRRA